MKLAINGGLPRAFDDFFDSIKEVYDAKKIDYGDKRVIDFHTLQAAEEIYAKDDINEMFSWLKEGNCSISSDANIVTILSHWEDSYLPGLDAFFPGYEYPHRVGKDCPWYVIRNTQELNFYGDLTLAYDTGLTLVLPFANNIYATIAVAEELEGKLELVTPTVVKAGATPIKVVLRSLPGVDDIHLGFNDPLLRVTLQKYCTLDMDNVKKKIDKTTLV